MHQAPLGITVGDIVATNDMKQWQTHNNNIMTAGVAKHAMQEFKTTTTTTTVLTHKS